MRNYAGKGVPDKTFCKVVHYGMVFWIFTWQRRSLFDKQIREYQPECEHVDVFEEKKHPTEVRSRFER